MYTLKQANSRLGILATSSKRLNKLLLLLASLAVFLALMCYWAISHFFDEERYKISSDFSHLMLYISEHDAFLRLAASLYSRANQNIVTYVHPSSSSLLMRYGSVQVYESRGLPQSLPFTLSHQETYTEGDMQGAFSWAIQLTDFYNTYWARSSFSAPQLFMFAPTQQFNVVVPHIEAPSGKKLLLADNFPRISTDLYQGLLAVHKKTSDSQVRWMLAPASLEHAQIAMIGYIGLDLPERVMPTRKNRGLSTLAVLLNPDDAHLAELKLTRPLDSHLTLIAPNGEVLLGEKIHTNQVAMGLSMDGFGMHYSLKSTHNQPWVGVYSVSYQGIFHYVKWALLAIFLVFSLMLLIGWRFSRWYRARIVEPAERANQELTESEAFSRAILENAPIGLCVVDLRTGQLLAENQRAQQWQGTSELINALDLSYSRDEQGDVQIKVAERHLQVCFASTRYQGKDVVLCGFNDITRHIAATHLMDQARQSADEASKAKTRFLQTISHKIRTPLYGVLGNLELLALTDLSQRQKSYLTSIEQSSSELFQLISNVLDISKIDAKQMAINVVTFCPLDLFEDAVKAHALAAKEKGLQIYACADGKLPALMRGDPVRIRQIINNLLSNAIKFTDFGQVALRLKVTRIDPKQASLRWQVSDTGRGMSEEQRSELFTPFSQLPTQHAEEGAALGLSICSRLCELMNARLQVVSEAGLGSSFNLSIDLPISDGELPHADHIQIQGMPVLVHAPTKELEQNLIDWLTRWGAQARPIPQERHRELAEVLIDISSESEQNRWSLFQSSKNNSDAEDASLAVMAYDIRAIARELTQLHNGVPPVAPPQKQQAFSPCGLQVLIVESNTTSRTVLQGQLNSLGVVTTPAENGERALKLWLVKKFDLVITSVDLPTFNGYDLARALRRQNTTVPIVGVTVNGLREEGDLCLAAGMNAWLVNPLRLQDILKVLQTWCSQAQSHTLQDVTDSTEDLTGWITMSAQMRQLFIETMTDDLEKARQALTSGNQPALQDRLHRMHGALAAVNARALADSLNQLEITLKTNTINTDSTRQLRTLLSRIDSAVVTLEKNTIP